MSGLDWAIFAAYLLVIVGMGAWLARKSRTESDFFLAGRSMPWWAIGLSVMATQASAITFIGTTGKAYTDGLRFVQFYFGLPLAMAILAFTLVPMFHRARVFTAYEWLGQRFDDKTRLLTAILFLASRGLALGVVIYAPSVVLSLLLGWSLPVTILTMTTVAVLYTMAGGIRAVIWTDVLQMILIVGGMGLVLLAMLARLPADIPLGSALAMARETGRLDAIDWSLDPDSRYTIWSGLVGGTFLFLAYFGCDQSQVQRFLTGRSLTDSRLALLFNAVLKIPMQLGVLFIGVVLFLVYQFEPPPLLFDPATAEALASVAPAEWDDLQQQHAEAHRARRAAGVAWMAAGDPAGQAAGTLRSTWLAAQADVDAVRSAATGLARREADAGFDDTNHVFPFFVLNALPAGLVGLLIAAIFAAAMSSIDSELNSLSTCSVIDIWQRHIRPGATDAQGVVVSRGLTVMWGALAAVFALYAGALGSVVEAVNILGSYFYGSLLGVFALAAFRRANGHGAFLGLLTGMGATFAASQAGLAWLWLNPVGCVTVVVVGLSVSRLPRAPVAGQ